MNRKHVPDTAREPITIVAPTVARARAARRTLGLVWEGASLVPLSLRTFLERGCRSPILLCPDGRGLDADLAFLRRVRARILWPAPDGDLAAAIAGLRGEHPPPLAGPAKVPPASGDAPRKRALLLEGLVESARARAALASQRRHWIVESPLRVRLTERELEELRREGVRWTALEPVRVAALLASPALLRAREQWRDLLPPRTKVRVLKQVLGVRC